MTSKPRQYHTGYWYHVYARGIEELPLYNNDEERRWFIEKMDEVFVRRDVNLGALCLMDTHYHALVRMGPVSLGRVLQGLHMSYARFINRTRGRGGPVFRDRPGADIVLDDSYILQLVPYLHRNPLDAGMVNDLREYEWHTDSLYRFGSWNQGAFDSWLFPPNFDGPDRRRVYLERLGEDSGDIPRGEGFVGDKEDWRDLDRRDSERKDRFRDRRGRQSMEQIAETVADDHGVSLSRLKRPGRSPTKAEIRHEAMRKLYEKGYGPTEIGEFFNRNKGTVVYAVNKDQD